MRIPGQPSPTHSLARYWGRPSKPSSTSVKVGEKSDRDRIAVARAVSKRLFSSGSQSTHGSIDTEVRTSSSSISSSSSSCPVLKASSSILSLWWWRWTHASILDSDGGATEVGRCREAFFVLPGIQNSVWWGFDLSRLIWFHWVDNGYI